MDLAEPARQPPRKPFVPALPQRRNSARRFSRVTYWPAAWNRTISSAGTRPLSLTSMPWPLAQARTSAGADPPGREEALPVLARREVPPPALRAASMKGRTAFRNFLGVHGIQVDLAGSSVHREPDGGAGSGAVDVIGQDNPGALSHGGKDSVPGAGRSAHPAARMSGCQSSTRKISQAPAGGGLLIPPPPSEMLACQQMWPASQAITCSVPMIYRCRSQARRSLGTPQAFPCLYCRLAGPLRHVHASRVPGLLRGLRPIPAPLTDDVSIPPARMDSGQRERRGMVPVFTANRSISLASSFAPAASPRLRRRPSP
jgi:hypothetical protein